MLRILSDLSRCRALRSLSLQFNCSAAFGMREILRSMRIAVSPIPLEASRVFIDAFSDVLGAAGAPAFPELEQLSLAFLTSLNWLSECGPAFERLAHVCLETDDSGRRRYPRISRLDVRVVITGLIRTVWPNGGLEKARTQFEQDRETMVLPMLASFVQGGIVVEVTME
ncbi:hypothetical protein C8Q73DRAFT_709430 [Cubamyces lactineus]|nr:hypothetical protein C8Q73DRAFT_709430 [Cubamyces lactineus]